MLEVRESNSALRGFARVYTINGIEGYDAQSFLEETRRNMTSVLRNNRGTKVKLIFKCYIKILSTSEIIDRCFHSNIKLSIDGTNEEELYATMTDKILERLATFLASTSECVFHSVIQLDLHIVRYSPLGGETYIPLPEWLKNKNAIINILNKDNKCFLWCVLRPNHIHHGIPIQWKKAFILLETAIVWVGIIK